MTYMFQLFHVVFFMNFQHLPPDSYRDALLLPIAIGITFFPTFVKQD